MTVETVEELRARFREQLSLGDPQLRRVALNALGLGIAERGYTLEIPESMDPNDREALVSGYFTGALFRQLRDEPPARKEVQSWWRRWLGKWGRQRGVDGKT